MRERDEGAKGRLGRRAVIGGAGRLAALGLVLGALPARAGTDSKRLVLVDGWVLRASDLDADDIGGRRR